MIIGQPQSEFKAASLETSKATEILNRKQLLSMASASDAEAQFQLGMSLLWGTGGLVQEKRAVEWLQKAALNKHFLAKALLAVCMAYGTGVEKNENLAKTNLAEVFPELEETATAGNADAKFILSLCFDTPLLSKIDPNKSWKNLLAAAEQGHACAQYTLAGLYDPKKNTAKPIVIKDLHKAAYYYHCATQRGHHFAGAFAGRAYLELSINNAKINPHLSFCYLQKAASCGEEKANTVGTRNPEIDLLITELRETIEKRSLVYAVDTELTQLTNQLLAAVNNKQQTDIELLATVIALQETIAVKEKVFLQSKPKDFWGWAKSLFDTSLEFAVRKFLRESIPLLPKFIWEGRNIFCSPHVYPKDENNFSAEKQLILIMAEIIKKPHDDIFTLDLSHGDYTRDDLLYLFWLIPENCMTLHLVGSLSGVFEVLPHYKISRNVLSDLVAAFPTSIVQVDFSDFNLDGLKEEDLCKVLLDAPTQDHAINLCLQREDNPFNWKWPTVMAKRKELQFVLKDKTIDVNASPQTLAKKAEEKQPFKSLIHCNEFIPLPFVRDIKNIIWSYISFNNVVIRQTPMASCPDVIYLTPSSTSGISPLTRPLQTRKTSFTRGNEDKENTTDPNESRTFMLQFFSPIINRSAPPKEYEEKNSPIRTTKSTANPRSSLSLSPAGNSDMQESQTSPAPAPDERTVLLQSSVPSCRKT